MNIIKSFLAASAALLLVSCNGGMSLTGVQMDTEEGVQKVVDVISQNIDASQWKLVELSWMDMDLSNDLTVISTRIVDKDGHDYVQSFAGSDFQPSAPSESYNIFGRISSKEAPAIDMKKLDAKRIMKHVETAKKMIPAEYEFKSLGRYELSSNSTDENRAEHFTINVTEKGKEYVRSAGKESLVYYQLEFYVDPDGNIVSSTLEKMNKED